MQYEKNKQKSKQKQIQKQKTNTKTKTKKISLKNKWIILLNIFSSKRFSFSYLFIYLFGYRKIFLLSSSDIFLIC